MKELANFAEKYLEMLRVRFFQEAMWLYRISDHPSIEGSLPRIMSFVGHYKERDYYVMDYIEGLTFREFVEKYGPLNEPTAITLIKQIAHVMRKVHERGFLHRDISPNNIVLPKCTEEKNGMPRPYLAVIVDFGNARSFDSKITLRRSFGESTGDTYLSRYMHDVQVEIKQNLEPLLDDPAADIPELMEATQSGTCCFAAPESLDGWLGSDTYSLTATLYYILTGENPSYTMFTEQNEIKTALLLRKHNVSEKTILFLRKMLNVDNSVDKRNFTMGTLYEQLPDENNFDFEFVKKLNEEWIKSQN
jgi:serine/threonine protein kinase